MALILYPELLESRTYTFQRLRHMFEHMGVQEGVWGATDLKVVQRAAGANLSVDVGAGAAFVKGDTGTRQGLYHAVNDATVNLVVGAAHATNPRIDQVILRIFDSTVSGGSDVPTLSVLAGTATGGATLDNRTGAAALPNDAIRLADILVPATDTTITDNQIRDRRLWCRGAREIVESAADYSITATSLADLPSGTGLHRQIELSGAPVIMKWHGVALHGTADQYLAMVFMADGNAVGKPSGHFQTFPVASRDQSIMFETVWEAPTPGSYLIKPQARVGAGTATLRGTITGQAFVIAEDIRQSAANG